MIVSPHITCYITQQRHRVPFEIYYPFIYPHTKLGRAVGHLKLVDRKTEQEDRIRDFQQK